MPPPLSFFGNYSETVQFSILKFSDFSQIIVSDIFGLIHFFVSFSVWAVEGHFFAYISEHLRYGVSYKTKGRTVVSMKVKYRGACTHKNNGTYIFIKVFPLIDMKPSDKTVDVKSHSTEIL